MFGIGERDLVRPVDFVIGEDAILEDKPAGAPASSHVHPFVQDASNAAVRSLVQQRRSTGNRHGAAGGGVGVGDDVVRGRCRGLDKIMRVIGRVRRGEIGTSRLA